MATLTNQIVTRAGVIPTYTACAGGGDACTCSADTFLHVKNGSGGSLNVTLAIPAGVSQWGQVVYTSSVIAVGAGAEKMIGPIQPQLYQDPTTGLCTITYSGVTSLTIACITVLEP